MQELHADIELLTECIAQYTDDMTQYLTHKLTMLGCTVEVDASDNVIAYKGNTDHAPLLIAHTDTVFDDPPWSLYTLGDYLVGFDDKVEQCGIGADDRAGVAAILQIIPHLDNVIALFPAYEECGCMGTNALDITYVSPASIAIQLDRRIRDKDKSDAIWHTNGTPICSMEFKDHIKQTLLKYNYHLQHGVYTDIGELKYKGLKCSALNLSIGYMREHSDSEVLHIPSYERALNLTVELINVCKGHVFPFNVKRDSRQNNVYGFDDWRYDHKAGKYIKIDSRKDKRYRKQWYDGEFDQEYMYTNKSYTQYSNDDFSDEIAMFDRCDICGNDRQLFFRSQGKDICYVCRECITAYKL